MFAHCSALFLCNLSVFHCDNFYFFMLHFFILHYFHVAPFCVVIFLCCIFFFVLHSFYVLHFFRLHFYTLQCVRFGFLHLLHSSHVAIFSFCTLFMLHYFQRCSQDLRKYLIQRAWQQQLTKPLNIVAKIFILDVRGSHGYTSTISMLVVLFSFFILFMLHFLHIEKQ